MTSVRHVVVEGSPATVAAIVARLRRSGQTVDDLAGTGTAWRSGPVRTREEAGSALLAALDGARLVVQLEMSPTERIVFVDDLRRIGPVDHRVGPTHLDPLDDDQRALLRELAAGRSLGEAAESLHLSRRTADRRLAAARGTLGAVTTAEAVAAYSAASGA